MEVIGEKIIKIGAAVLENPMPQKDGYGAFEIEIKEALHPPATPDDIKCLITWKSYLVGKNFFFH